MSLSLVWKSQYPPESFAVVGVAFLTKHVIALPLKPVKHLREGAMTFHEQTWNVMAPSLRCLTGFSGRAITCFVKKATPTTAKDSGGYWLFQTRESDIGLCAYSRARLILELGFLRRG